MKRNIAIRIVSIPLLLVGAACSDDSVVARQDAGGINADIAVDAGDATLPSDDTADTAAASGPCDDGRACTVGDTYKNGVCVSGDNVCNCEPGFVTCGAADRGDVVNLCRGAKQCVAAPFGAAKPFACLSDASKHKVCDDSLDSACEKNACAPLTGTCALVPTELVDTICDMPKGGCRFEALTTPKVDSVAAPCDDGLICTQGDACAGGICTSGKTTCDCLQDSDCIDDGDLCNGTPFCNKAGALWTCAINPVTVVVCDTSTDNVCTKTACDPGVGTCSKGPKPLGVACDDGVDCTKGDICNGEGKCSSGTWTCCKSDADCVSADDGDLCNGSFFCNQAAGSCDFNPATVVNCQTVDDTACSKASCDAKTGKCSVKAVNPGLSCDDGSVCTKGEVCVDGLCDAGKDVCLCKTDADCASQDDGNLCNGVPYCNLALGACKPNPATVVTCAKGADTACSATICLPTTGQCSAKLLPDSTPCDADGTSCTPFDSCDGKGGCVASANTCLCNNDADCAAKDDGDLCNGQLFCDLAAGKPTCKVNPATVLSCPSVKDGPCQQNSCQPLTGACVMQFSAKNAPCKDSDPCTGDDRCNAVGQCVGGGKLLCGCATTADCKLFNDADVCNGSYACVGGACAFDGKALLCDDAKTCTVDSCDKSKGCVFSPIAGCANCDQESDCEDGNACTFEFCVQGQCSLQPAPIACNDGDACTAGDSCQDGSCKAGKAIDCNDETACTDDACDAKTGCSHAANTLPCDDGDACSVKDACSQGSCAAGAALDCDDGKLCTDDACDKVKGCSHTPSAAGGKVSCYTGPDNSAGVGACQAGARTCDGNGDAGPCVGEVTPTTDDGCGGGDQDCDGSSDEDCEGVAQLVVACGGGQSARPGGGLFEKLLVQAVDLKGNPQGNVAIEWTAPDGGSVALGTTTTNANGMAGNAMTLGNTSGKTYRARARVAGSAVVVDIPALADAALPELLFHYNGFCDVGKLQLKGSASYEPGKIGLVAPVDVESGALWVKSAITPGASFSARVDVSGFAPAYSFVVQATTTGAATLGGGANDTKTPTLSPALVVQIGGTKTQSATMRVYANGVQIGEAPAVLSASDNGQPQTLWVDYLQASGALQIAIAPPTASKPSKAALQVNVDLWAKLGGGSPAYAGLTAGNGSGGAATSKYVDAFWLGYLDAPCFTGLGPICEDNDPCTDNVCDKALGCSYEANSAPCSDDDACTDGDGCKSGTCVPGTLLTCDDGNTCSDDSCDKATGCVQLANTAACSDSDSCTGPDLCKNKACVAGAFLNCDDGNVCTDDSCGSGKVCVNAPNIQQCADATACLDPGYCKDKSCAAGVDSSCDDKVPCTKDSCDAKAGCVHTADNSLCDDGKPCTNESCDAKTGCTHTSLPNGFSVGCYSGPQGTAGVGICVSGTSQCDGKGGASACNGEVVPKPLDDCLNGNEDCDVLTDEDCGTPYKISAVCGGGQQAKPGQQLLLPLRVLVTDGSNNPLNGTKVTWTSADGATFANANSVSDGNGHAIAYLKVGDTDGQTYTAVATIDGTAVKATFSAQANSAAADYLVNYTTFCDTSKLAKTGIAAFNGNSVLVVTGADSTNGSFWSTQPLTANKSLAIKVGFSGYTRGYALVLQSVASGVGQTAGGYADGNTTKLNPAFVLYVTGGKSGNGDMELWSNGVQIAAKASALNNSQNTASATIWLDYDHAGTKVSVYVGNAGSSKPVTPVLSVTANLWGTLGNNGKPIYAGFTAGNSSAGQNGTKYVTSWVMQAF